MSAEADLDRLIVALTARATNDHMGAERAGRVVWRTLCGRLLDGIIEPARLDLWFGSDVVLPLSAPPGPEPSPAALCAAFERTMPLRVIGAAKRDQGVYYTPRALAELVVATTLAPLREHVPDVRSWRIIDPASGAGAFAASVVDAVTTLLVADGVARTSAQDHALTHSVHLVDADPLAVAVARCLLLAEFGTADTDLDALERHVRCGDAVIGGPDPRHGSGFGWSTEFPEAFADGGFHAVVGNPPWGAVKPSLREFASTLDPALLRLDGVTLRSRLATPVGEGARAAADARRAYSAGLRAAGYRWQGGGDTEIYRFFVELSHGLVRSGGVVGLLVPSALQRADGAAKLRQLLLGDGVIECWLDFLNAKGIFAIHKMFRFSMLVWRQGPDRGIRRARFGLLSVEEAQRALAERPVTLSNAFLRTVSPERLTIPDVRSSGQAELYARLHRAHPPLGERSVGPWSVRFRRELDMTNDAAMFRTVEDVRQQGAVPDSSGSWWHPDDGELLPVFEGRMVHQHDSAAKGHVRGHGRSAQWETLPGSRKELRPRFVISAAEAERRGIRRVVRASFCDVTGHANERTVLAALVPAVAACGNKVPTCEFSSDDPALPALWTSVANSFVIDWMARRRVSTTLNFFHWEELPFPRLDPASAVGRRLVSAADELAGAQGRPWSTTLARRAQLRAEIDVEVALQFGLEIDDMVVVLDDFPLLDRGATADHRTVTRDLVLAGLAARLGVQATLSDLGLRTDDGPTQLAERSTWHEAAGAVGYLPGEAAAAMMAESQRRPELLSR